MNHSTACILEVPELHSMLMFLKNISNSSYLNYISELSLSNGKIEVVLAFCTAHDVVFTNDYSSILLNKSMLKLSQLSALQKTLSSLMTTVECFLNKTMLEGEVMLSTYEHVFAPIIEIQSYWHYKRKERNKDRASTSLLAFLAGNYKNS